MEKITVKLISDGRPVTWTSLPCFCGPADNKNSLIAEAVKSIKEAGAKSVVVLR